MGKMRKTKDHISEVWATQLSENMNLPIKGNISVIYITADDFYHHSDCTEPHQPKKSPTSCREELDLAVCKSETGNGRWRLSIPTGSI